MPKKRKKKSTKKLPSSRGLFSDYDADYQSRIMSGDPIDDDRVMPIDPDDRVMPIRVMAPNYPTTMSDAGGNFAGARSMSPMKLLMSYLLYGGEGKDVDRDRMRAMIAHDKGRENQLLWQRNLDNVREPALLDFSDERVVDPETSGIEAFMEYLNSKLDY